MFTLDANDFWTQALSALLAGLALLFVQPQWLRRPKVAPTSVQTRAGVQLSGRNQMVNTGQVHGDLHQEVVDRSQRTTIINNIRSANPAPGESTSSASGSSQILVASLAAVIGAALFLMFQRHLLAVSIGAALGLLILAAVAAARTRRLVVSWPTKAATTALISVSAVLVTAVSWVNVSTTVRGDLSLERIRVGLASTTTSTDAAPLAVYVKEFFQTMIPGLMATGAPTVFFVLSLMLGVLAAFGLVVVAWFRILEWHAYLHFSNDTEAGGMTVNRAKNFSDGKVLSDIVCLGLIASLAIFLSSGNVYDLYMNLPGLEIVETSTAVTGYAVP